MTHPASGHLFSGLGWVTGDCLSGPAHGHLGLPPEAPSPTWGRLLPSPCPLPHPPLSPSSSSCVLPLYLGTCLPGPQSCCVSSGSLGLGCLCLPALLLSLCVSPCLPPSPPHSSSLRYLLPLTSGSPSSCFLGSLSSISGSGQHPWSGLPEKPPSHRAPLQP